MFIPKSVDKSYDPTKNVANNRLIFWAYKWDLTLHYYDQPLHVALQNNTKHLPSWCPSWRNDKSKVPKKIPKVTTWPESSNETTSIWTLYCVWAKTDLWSCKSSAVLFVWKLGIISKWRFYLGKYEVLNIEPSCGFSMVFPSKFWGTKPI